MANEIDQPSATDLLHDAYLSRLRGDIPRAIERAEAAVRSMLRESPPQELVFNLEKQDALSGTAIRAS